MWCWWCCHEIPGEPLHLPYKYDEHRAKFSLMGNFCSWGCMKAFNFDKHGVNQGGIISCNIIMMRKKLYGVLGPIRSAPYRYLLKEFGGPMTIEEFRKGSTVDTGPRVGSIDAPVATESYNIGPRQVPVYTSTKLSEISNSVGTNEPLRLKRSKPLKRDDNNLEKTLGIIRKTPSKTVACL